MKVYTWRVCSGVVALLSLVLTPASVWALCAGDCNGNGRVTVDESLRAVNLALGQTAYRLCPPADIDGNDSVVVDELLRAVDVRRDGCPATVDTYRAPAQQEPAVPVDSGHAFLPNGRQVLPAGTQVAAETLPLNLALTPDGRYLLVTNDGHDDEAGNQHLSVIDTQDLTVTETAVPQFFGLAVTPAGDRVFVGNDSGPDQIDALRLASGALVREPAPFVQFPDATFPSGLALSPDGTHLFALGMRSNSFYSIDVTTAAVTHADVPVGNLPYSVIVSHDGQRAYVSSWGTNNGNPTDVLPAPLPPVVTVHPERSSVAVLDISDPVAPRLLRYIPIAAKLRINNQTIFGGSHPTAMQLSPDGSLLYVTATNLDVLDVIDTASLQNVAEISLNVFDDAPVERQLQGLYPNALAISPDGRRLYIADAGINAVQVLAVDPVARTFQPAGFIPVGWYPTALALSSNGTRLYVANSKGVGVGPNGGEEFDSTPHSTTFIGELLKGSVSVIDGVDHYDLATGQTEIMAANGFVPAAARWVDGPPGNSEVQRDTPVPIDFGSGPSDLIRHVVFILKENRTYDQILGDQPGANGDAELAFFGGDVTPNIHALAGQFAFGDNFYDEGEISIPGHEWIDQGNCTDFTEKLWPGGFPDSILQEGQEQFSKGGFIFEALGRQHIPYRVYGETLALLSRFSAGSGGGGPGSLVVPITSAFGHIPTQDQLFSLVNGDIDTLRAQGVNIDLLKQRVWPNFALGYPANIVASIPDVQRAQLFLGELTAFAATGSLPNYIQIWLPNDHTWGADPGTPTPNSAVADNDEALGMIVDGLTHSPFWNDMAIFVTEDDPQDGQDHVGAHRTVAAVISPYVKHGYVSHVHHSNVGMTKTVELLLGATPMSQFDRFATDMRDYFTPIPDDAPYVGIPRRIPVAMNSTAERAPNVYLRRAAMLSAHLNLTFYDTAGPELSHVLELVHSGQTVERQRTWAVAGMLQMLGALIGGGALVRRWRGR